MFCIYMNLSACADDRYTVESLYLEVRGTFVKTSSYRKFDVQIIGVLDTGYESDRWRSTGRKLDASLDLSSFN